MVSIQRTYMVDVHRCVAMMEKRDSYITWDEFFMMSAKLASERSKDPCTQVGAVIVSDDMHIVGSGYNGFPRGLSDDFGLWGKNTGSELTDKYTYVVHAELNAILNTGANSVSGCSLYVTKFPCNECAKAIIQSGIKRVVYASKPSEMTDLYLASEEMLSSAQVLTVPYRGSTSLKLEI